MRNKAPNNKSGATLAVPSRILSGKGNENKATQPELIRVRHLSPPHALSILGPPRLSSQAPRTIRETHRLRGREVGLLGRERDGVGEDLEESRFGQAAAEAVTGSEVFELGAGWLLLLFWEGFICSSPLLLLGRRWCSGRELQRLASTSRSSLLLRDADASIQQLSLEPANCRIQHGDLGFQTLSLGQMALRQNAKVVQVADMLTLGLRSVPLRLPPRKVELQLELDSRRRERALGYGRFGDVDVQLGVGASELRFCG